LFLYFAIGSTLAPSISSTFNCFAVIYIAGATLCLLFGCLMYDLYREQFGANKIVGNASVLDLSILSNAMSIVGVPGVAPVANHQSNTSQSVQQSVIQIPISVTDPNDLDCIVQTLVLQNLDQLHTFRELHGTKLTAITSQMKKLHKTFKEMKKLLTVNKNINVNIKMYLNIHICIF
jgi:hypothetical protein